MSDTAASEPPIGLQGSMSAKQPDATAPDSIAWISALLELGDDAGIGISVQRADDGRYLHVNRTLAAVFGQAAEQLIGRFSGEGLAPAVAAALRQHETDAVRSPAGAAALQRIGYGADERIFQVTRRPLAGADAGPGLVLYCVWREVLTSERASFDVQLRREIQLTQREQREFALLWIGTDQPAEAITAGGEAVQDPIGQWLREQVRAMDAVFRFAPGHHGVLLSGVGLAHAHQRADALLRTHRGRSPAARMTIGVASCPHTERDPDALVAAASGAWQRALGTGGDRIALAPICFDRTA